MLYFYYKLGNILVTKYTGAYGMLSVEDLKERVYYDSSTGVFIWAARTNHKTVVGAPAGHVARTGYLYIGIKGRPYPAGRLAWLYVYGEWPDGLIDHINRDRSDNRISNLRVVTASQSNYNRVLTKKNKTGFTGVYPQGKKYRAEARVAGVAKVIGLYDSPEEAAEAYERFVAPLKGEHAPTTEHTYRANPYPTILQRQQLKKDLEDLIW